MFRGQQQNKDESIPSVSPIRTRRASRRLRLAIMVGIVVLVSGLSASAESENVEVVVWDTGPSIQGDDGAIVTISGPVSYEFYAGPDEDQSNPHPLYLPAGDYSFTVTAVWPQQPNIDGTSDQCGRHGQCYNSDIATFYIDFRAYESAPIAEDDHESTAEDTPVNIAVLDNDSASTRITLDGSEDTSVAFETETLRRTTGPDLCCGDVGYPETQTFDLNVEIADTALGVIWVGAPSHGSAAINPDGSITYTPDDDYCGADQFEYTIEDQNGSDTATVTIEIRCVSDPPIAGDDSAITDENSYINIDVTANDADLDGAIDKATVSIVANPSLGEISVDPATGVVTYTPDPGMCGSDNFTYTVDDFEGATSNVATVTIDIVCNEPPEAHADFANTDENTSIGINAIANDTDSDGTIDPSSVTITAVPEYGELSVHPSTGVVTYTPDPGACGVDSFRYTVDDDDGATSNEATVTIDVMCDDPPLAIDDLYTVAEGETLDVSAPGVLANDVTSPWEPLTAILVSDVSYGTLSLEPDGSFIYIHGGSETTSDSFTYYDNDGTEDSNVATANIVVTPTNDDPTAEDDEDATDEDTPVTVDVLANDSDPEGDVLVVESVTQPLHGAVVPSGGSVVYTPSPGFSGTDTFAYAIADGHGGTDTATVTVNVLATNDPPEAQDDNSEIREDRELTMKVLLNDSDPDGDSLVVQSVTQPDHGVAINNGIDITYTPDPDFHGVDSFTYTISDGNGQTAEATVTVTVTPVNDPPLAQDDSVTTNEETMVMIPVLANDSDPDGDFLLVESFGQPVNGTVLNARTGVSYIPDPDFKGIDTFTYSISDGNGGTATATVTVSVAAVNAPPSAQDDNAVTDEGVPVTILVLLNDSDPDGDAIAVESVTEAENGAVSNNGTDVTYTPDPGYSGVDIFSYTVSDGRGGTDMATVFAAVAPVNDPPMAQDDSATTERDAPITIFVLKNDSDPDGDAIAIESVTPPLNGTVTSTGFDIVYSPNEGFAGTDTFTYTVSDGRGNTDTATVTVGVSSETGAGAAAAETPCEGKVIISEVAWAGTAADPRDEWIELRNLGTISVDLAGWELRWRRSHPATPGEQVWKAVKLSGVLSPSSGQACDQTVQSIEPAVRFFQESPGDIAWFLSSEIDEADTGYFVLERRHDDVISDLEADLLYDTSPALNLGLSDLGEVIMLVNKLGEVVDTANASNLGRNGWSAGSAATFATMERINPRGGDVAGNWHTNPGIVTHGDDAKGRLLRATPGSLNSPIFEDVNAYAEIEPVMVRAGEILQVGFLLPRQERQTTGWPWISVSRPGSTGAGGGTGFTGYSFSGRYEGGDRYLLDIDTKGLPPGSYVFWVIYGQGQAVIVPIIVTP